MEIPIIKDLIKENKKMIFVLNNLANTRNEYKKLLEITNSTLKHIVNSDKEIE